MPTLLFLVDFCLNFRWINCLNLDKKGCLNQNKKDFR